MDNDKSPSWNTYGDDEPDSNEYTPLKKNNQDFFGAYMASRLSQLGELSKPDTEEDDEDEESGTELKPKKKKYSGILREIFPIIVEPIGPVKETDPVTSNQKEETAEIRDTENLENRTEEIVQISERGESNTAVKPDEVKINHQIEEITESETTLEPEDFNKKQEVDAKQRAEDFSEDKIENDRQTSEKSEVNYVVPPVPPPIAMGFNRGPEGAEPVNRVENATSTTVAKERIIEKRPVGAVLAFLGANYLSKRRDRKLTSEFRKQKETIDHSYQELKNSQLSQKQAQENLQKHQQKQGEKLAALQLQETKHQKRVPDIDKRPEAVNFAKYEPARVESPENRMSESVSVPFNIPEAEKKYPEQEIQKQIERKIKYTEIEDRLESSLKEEIRDKREEIMNTPESIRPILDNKHETLIKDRIRSRQRFNPAYISSQQNSYNEKISQEELVVGKNNSLQKSKPNIKNIDIKEFKHSIEYGVGTAVVILALTLIYYLLR